MDLSDNHTYNQKNIPQNKAESEGSKQTRFKKDKTIRQDNIQIFINIIFFKYRTRQIKTTKTNNKVTYLN